ncbi:hypothetical protein M8J77_023128 [Diaphorina citri]|nr:hypothetical protein M8J77_023128 [Diaphorina citri]
MSNSRQKHGIITPHTNHTYTTTIAPVIRWNWIRRQDVQDATSSKQSRRHNVFVNILERHNGAAICWNALLAVLKRSR